MSGPRSPSIAIQDASPKTSIFSNSLTSRLIPISDCACLPARYHRRIRIWETGPGLDPAPFQVNLHGLGAVPIWFVSWPELQTLIADRVLTISELSSLTSLRIGSAQLYTETLHPAESAQVGLIRIDAQGSLADGTRFQLQVAAEEPFLDEECCSSEVTRQHVLIRFR